MAGSEKSGHSFQSNADVWLIFDRLNTEAGKRGTRGKAQSIGKMLDGQEGLGPRTR
jgi:hypothetical protein